MAFALTFLSDIVGAGFGLLDGPFGATHRQSLQFSADRPILNPDQRRLILRREVV
jgi:hypothetical protein